MKNFVKYFIFCLLVSVFSCEDESFPYVPPTTEVPSDEDFIENFGDQISASFLGRVVDENNNPIEGVNIQIENATAITDAFGVFSIRDANVYERFAYIRAEKIGYINGSRALVPSESEINQVQIMLLEKTVTETISSGESSTVSLSNGSEITFDGNFVSASGATYLGPVNVTLKHLSPDDDNMSAMMPGMLYAQNASGNDVALETYGMLAVELSTSGGEPLQLAENSKSRITIPLATDVTNPPATIPLWYFDENVGYWKEDGGAILQGNQYIGEVSHFTFWNYDYPYPAVNLCITLRDTNGNILPNTALDLYSELLNATGTYGFTNSNGEECGLVPADEELTITVYSPLCTNQPFTATIGPFSFDVNTTVIVDLENDITFTGSFLTCEGLNVSNGYVQLSIDGISQIIPVTDGVIDYTFNSCGVTNYSYKGIDLENSQETQVFTGAINDSTETIDAGSFSACDTFEDADGDSIPDALEDVDGDNNLDNDDTDNDGIPNYLDDDDDDDGINTINEDYDGDNNPLNDDTDDDGVPNYLDNNDLNLFDAETGSNGCEPVTYDFGALFANVYNVANTDYVFYETEADATSEINPIALPYTLTFAEAVLNPTIFVKATSATTGQTGIASVFLFLNDFDSDNDGLTDCEETTGVDNPNTNLIPTGMSDPNDPDDPNMDNNSPSDGVLQVCDDNNDGFSNFDLTSMDSFFLNGNDPANYQISYHLTDIDATNGVQALPSPFFNTTNPQTLFVRVFEISTGNYETSLLTLEVVPAPVMPALADIVECDVNADGLATFNLSSLEILIIDENPGIDIIVTYYSSQVDADSGINPIDAASFANIDNNSQIIFVRAENLVTNCFSTGQVNLVVDSGC
ncbi:MAG: carboxypeptidase regulatory-like domain-containing protein [Winogradskyella sp.]|nr:MAG: carboxypeptidase regulatory-like domain-containing protein [Winogradskyella sp.]